LWSAWGCDWRAGATPDLIATRATREVGAGDVVLLHDADHYSASGSWRRTVAALPRILDELGARGLRAVAV
jgi:peptidoglycan/xylan/chitin deacetylase (PgdA/CDA1 family)